MPYFQFVVMGHSRHEDKQVVMVATLQASLPTGMVMPLSGGTWTQQRCEQVSPGCCAVVLGCGRCMNRCAVATRWQCQTQCVCKQPHLGCVIHCWVMVGMQPLPCSCFHTATLHGYE